jgi:hypothetical protein
MSWKCYGQCVEHVAGSGFPALRTNADPLSTPKLRAKVAS